MKRTLLSGILLLLCCIALITGIEHYDAVRQEKAINEAITRQLMPLQEKLQARLDALVAENRAIAKTFATQAQPDIAALEAIGRASLQRQPRLLSVVYARKLKVVHVHPTEGNEAIIGLDYGLHPEFLGSIKRAIASRGSVIDAPVRLLQTGRSGLVVRTPIFAADNEYFGMVSMAADIEGLLLEAGLLDPAQTFSPIIQQRTTGQAERTLFGEDKSQHKLTGGLRITLPDGEWVLYAVPKVVVGQAPERSAWIRGIGALVTFVLLLLLLSRGGFLHEGDATKGALRRRGYTLRFVMLVAVLILIPLLAGAAGWLSYHASMQVAERLEKQQAKELVKQIRDKVTAFFDVPRQAAIFNAELFRQGLLDANQPDIMLTAFLAQFRQQPMLTFISMGNTRGEYFAASRPPRGDDQNLRLLRATVAEGRAIKLFRVDDTNRPTTLVSVGNSHFDARTRPWYKTALAADSLKWYPPYRYAIHDKEGQYEAMGIGMAAPLYDAERGFVGVVTADVALSQLNDFLQAQTARLGGAAFIAEADGSLLASSASEPIYRIDGSNTLRIRAEQSDNPSIRMAGAAIHEAATTAGNHFIQVGHLRYLLDWQSVQLPDGPTLLIALILPESRFTGPAKKTLQDIAYLTLAFLGLGLLIALSFTYWVSHPLQLLEHWSRQLGAGEWHAPPPICSPISEIAGLTSSLGSMANELQRNAEELEQKVAERTAALEIANQQLAELSVTDGLTGIANRRRFDEILADEYARATRNSRPLSLLFLDVDLFKAYNDHHGHLAGDEALRQIAAVLSHNARRPGDLAARYGGEEFAIIAADTSAETALNLAESIRTEIEALALPHASAPRGIVTVSIGVANCDPEHPIDLTSLLGMADTALYQAKGAGRNRVEIAQHRQENQ